MSRDWLLYLDDVIESAEKIQRFLRTATLDTFSADELLFDAVLAALRHRVYPYEFVIQRTVLVTATIIITGAWMITTTPRRRH
ncbi:MAG: hypothetical protein IT531_01915 [Burkholderiales bacterium]|nr:hypothetical protein [Burkholderiales bacterium]